MSVLTTILFFLLLLGAIVWMSLPLDRETKRFFWSALTLKFFAGLLFGVVYSFYYQISDSHAYFFDAVTIAELASRDFYGYVNFLWDGEGHHANELLIFKTPRAVFLSKFCSLWVLIIGKNYWLITFSISVLTFFSTWFFFREFSKRFPGYRSAAFVVLFIFPSVIFWSSGISKESFALAGLYVLSVVALKLYDGIKPAVWETAAGLFFGWLVWNLKYYYLAAWLPITLAAVFVHRVLKPKAELTYFFILLLFLLLATGLLHPNFIWKHFIDVIVTNYQQLLLASEPGDAIHYFRLGETNDRFMSLFYIVMNAPWALISALARPFLWEVNSAMQLAASLENIGLLLVAAGCWQSYGRLFQPNPHRLLVIGILVYSVLLLIFLGLSTPNFGTLSRYRVGCLPFLLIVLLSHNKWFRKILLKIDSK